MFVFNAELIRYILLPCSWITRFITIAISICFLVLQLWWWWIQGYRVSANQSWFHLISITLQPLRDIEAQKKMTDHANSKRICMRGELISAWGEDTGVGMIERWDTAVRILITMSSIESFNDSLHSSSIYVIADCEFFEDKSSISPVFHFNFNMTHTSPDEPSRQRPWGKEVHLIAYCTIMQIAKYAIICKCPFRQRDSHRIVKWNISFW